MGTEITDLQEMMQTLAAASTDPNSVTVGDFAKAVQSLQAELKMLESEVNRLGTTVTDAFADPSTPGAHAGVGEPAAGSGDDKPVDQAG